MSTIDPKATVVASPELTSADLGGEAVLLDANTGRYFGLNAVGLRIFELAQEPRTVASIHEALLAEYDVTEDVLWRDLNGFLQTLLERDLVRIESSDVA